MENPKNYPEALKEAVDSNDLPEIENILSCLRNITNPIHIESIQNILNRHLTTLPEHYQINSQTFTVTEASPGTLPQRSWYDYATPFLLAAGLTIGIWLIVKYYHHIHEFFIDVGEQAVNTMLIRDFQLVRHSPEAVREIGLYLMQQGLVQTTGLPA